MQSFIVAVLSVDTWVSIDRSSRQSPGSSRGRGCWDWDFFLLLVLRKHHLVTVLVLLHCTRYVRGLEITNCLVFYKLLPEIRVVVDPNLAGCRISHRLGCRFPLWGTHDTSPFPDCDKRNEKR